MRRGRPRERQETRQKGAVTDIGLALSMCSGLPKQKWAPEAENGKVGEILEGEDDAVCARRPDRSGRGPDWTTLLTCEIAKTSSRREIAS